MPAGGAVRVHVRLNHASVPRPRRGPKFGTAAQGEVCSSPTPRRTFAQHLGRGWHDHGSPPTLLVSLSLSLAPSLCTTRNVGLPCPPRLQAYARRRRALDGEDDLPRLALPPRRHRRNPLGGLERLVSHRQRRRAPDSRRSTLRLRREPPLTLLDPRTRRPADSSHGFSPTSTRGTQVTVLTHPDSLLFDHPPRSAISWTPERHLASRKLHAAATTTAHRPPTGPAHPPSSLSAGPSPAPTIAAPSFTGSRVVTAVAGTDWHWELRLAGVLGRSLAGQ